MSMATAICMTVGKLSLDDWPRLTWSLGWTGALPPLLPVNSSFARPAMTSLAFMLVWVPEPVCQTTSGNSSSNLPSATSSAARAMTSTKSAGISPRDLLARAAAFF